MSYLKTDMKKRDRFDEGGVDARIVLRCLTSMTVVLLLGTACTKTVGSPSANNKDSNESSVPSENERSSQSAKSRRPEIAIGTSETEIASWTLPCGPAM